MKFSDTCLKEGKKFLSETLIFTYEALNEHINNGEFSENGNLFIPAHLSCPVNINK
jgi:hypothetical protein